VFHLLNVFDFSYVQMHVGNAPKDTLGCLLLGVWYGSRMWVSESVKTYKSFYLRYAPVARQGRLFIRIEDK